LNYKKENAVLIFRLFNNKVSTAELWYLIRWKEYSECQVTDNWTEASMEYITVLATG
jgi:hypothetical protein